MARRKKKSADVQNANQTSLGQNWIPLAPRSQAQQLKSKPAVADSAAGATEKRCQQAKPGAPSAPALRVSCPKAPVITVKPDTSANQNPGRQAQSSQKKNKPVMARRGNRTNPASAGRQALLDVPDSYVKPEEATKGLRRNRPKKAGQASEAQPGADKPWEMDPSYPEPQDSSFKFDYGRCGGVWHSFGSKDARKEAEKHLARGLRARLPKLFPDSTPDQLKQAHKVYWEANKSWLYKIRLNMRDAPVSSNLLIASPLAKHGEAQGVNPKNNNNGLLNLLQVGELGNMIIEHLNPSVGDITALAFTCKRAAACVQKHFEVWDFTRADFPTDEFNEKHDENGQLVQTGGVRTNTLIISPVSGEPRGETPYMADFLNMVQMCVAITEVPLSFRSLVLDRIPYLNVGMVEMMVNSMPNLRTMSITRCLLLDVTKLKPLLDIIKRHPLGSTGSSEPIEHDVSGHTPTGRFDSSNPFLSMGPVADDTKKLRTTTGEYIKLDFFPFFFRGPNSAKRLGSYGVTWNEPTFNTPKAVLCLIMRCWDLARHVGMDLVSDSSSFWSFVRQLPGPDALWAMKAREALITREHELAEGVKATQQIHHRFADDMTAALTGDNQKQPKVPERMARHLSPDHMGRFYWRRGARCNECQLSYPQSFFPIRRDICWGCKLLAFAYDMEDSHLRLWQQSAMKKWMHELDPRTATFADLIKYRAPTLDHAMDDARNADFVREYFLFKFQPNNDWKGPEPYNPPTPRGIDEHVASMARWRWNRGPATATFDYREGGPQRKDPCKEPMAIIGFQNDDVGPESEENFNKRWEWTARSDSRFKRYWEQVLEAERKLPPCFRPIPTATLPGDYEPSIEQRVATARQTPEDRRITRELERRSQNHYDKEMFRWHQPRVEDALYSMGTPAQLPFNLDQPLLDPFANKEQYDELIKQHLYQSSPYGFTSMKAGFW